MRSYHARSPTPPLGVTTLILIYSILGGGALLLTALAHVTLWLCHMADDALSYVQRAYAAMDAHRLSLVDST